MDNLWHSQYRKSERVLNRIQDLQHFELEDRFWEIDRLAIDTLVVDLQQHLLLPTDNRELHCQVTKLLQPPCTTDWIIFAKESLWIQLLPWTFSLPQKCPFGEVEPSDLCWPSLVENSGLHLTLVAAAPGQMVHGQTLTICWGGLTFGVSAVLVPLTQVVLGIGSGGCALAVSARLCFIGNEPPADRTAWFLCTWPRSRTSCWKSKLSCSMPDDKVDSRICSCLVSLSSSKMSWSVSSSCFMDEITDISHLLYDASRQIIGRQTFERKWRLAAFLNANALSRCAFWLFCKQWFLTWLGIDSICCHEDRQLGNVGESV